MTGPAGAPGAAAGLVHDFDADHGDRPAEELHDLLGRKGATLGALTRMGVPVPPGFTLTTAASRRYRDGGWDDAVEAALRHGLDRLEHATGRRLGDPAAPLVVAVRSGAARSMPGMLDTILDVGATDAVTDGLGALAGDPGFGADVRARARRSWLAATGTEPPADPFDQVRVAVCAVLDSWDADRVRRYRQLEGIPEGLGTAVSIQAMVFGNRPGDSGTGVAFTRDPSTGEPGLMGDFLEGAQGDDVVAGSATPRPLADLRDRWPAIWGELAAIGRRLERHLADAADLEFTVEDGRLWILQARPAPCSARAAVRIAVALAEDPDVPLDRSGAVERCRRLLDAPRETWLGAGPGAGTEPEQAVVVEGLPAAPGRAVGVLCIDAARADALVEAGADVVLVRRETSPADVPTLAAAAGLVTALGGLVSHAAVVARAWGLPAVVGASALRFVDGGVEGPGGFVAEGDVVTVDGDAGRLLRGAHPAAAGEEPPELDVLRRWAAELRRA